MVILGSRSGPVAFARVEAVNYQPGGETILWQLIPEQDLLHPASHFRAVRKTFT